MRRSALLVVALLALLGWGATGQLAASPGLPGGVLSVSSHAHMGSAARPAAAQIRPATASPRAADRTALAQAGAASHAGASRALPGLPGGSVAVQTPPLLLTQLARPPNARVRATFVLAGHGRAPPGTAGT